MSTAILDQEITNETAKLHEAQTHAQDVARRLAQKPGDAKLRAELTQAYRAISDAKANIEALQMARPAALDLERQTEEEARLAEIPKALDAVKALLAERVIAGKALDDALAALHEAAQAWVALSSKTIQAAKDFHRLAQPQVRMAPDFQIGGEAVSEIAHRVSEAVKGLDCRGLIDFGRYEGAAPVADAAQKSVERVTRALEHYAEQAAQ